MSDTTVTVFGTSDAGLARSVNEDAFVVTDLSETRPHPFHAMTEPQCIEVGERGVLLAVSDGMGGASAGEIASALTLFWLEKGMTQAETISAHEALRDSVARANERVFRTSRMAGRRGMGATLTAMLIHGTNAYIAEIGDSRAYLLRRGELSQLTHDQSYVQLLIDCGALTPEQATKSRHRHVVLQAVGTSPSIVVALNRLTLRSGDTLILCSDGLTRHLTDREIRAIVCGADGVDSAVARLIEIVTARGALDNVTVVAAHVEGIDLPRSASDRVSLETLESFVPPRETYWPA